MPLQLRIGVSNQLQEFLLMNCLVPSLRRRRWMIAVVIFVAARMLLFSVAESTIYEAGLFCGKSLPPPNTTFIPMFVTLMEGLSQRVTANGSGQNAVHSSKVSIYTLAQCYGYLRHNDCLQCYAASRTRLPRCLPSVSGRIYFDGCFLRYDNHSFFKESVDSVTDKVNCSSTVGDEAGGMDSDFRKNVGELLRNVTTSAVVNGGYAVREGKGVFGLAQCWNTLTKEGCRACFAKARREITGCLPGREGRALYTGCYVRYSTLKFFSNQSLEGNSNSGVFRRGELIAVVLAMIAFVMLCLFSSYAAFRRWKKQKQERNNLGQISYSYNKSGLNFKYEVLEKATNYFNPERKVGQGGAGSVYRGTLPSGKTVAVKRLFFSTRQWVDEFFNEVNLISGIEHKSLVKLLGCSIEGPESLLVYEFVPNKSLEHYLFEKNKVKVLSWKERYNIIVGIAEGLSFLHEGLELRIIHRDIKSSNVLLDENLDPKIADFGLARCFAADKTHLSTGIAGTLGYMAPEYLIKGQLTEKADVYSFGVLVLEIICGRKSNAFVEESGSLLQTVWKLYKTNKLTESVDPCLADAYPAKEASKVLTIGLLCAQASATQRPSMVDVVQMLTDENRKIPEPNQPPFLNTSSISACSTRSSYSLNSLMSGQATKAQASYTSTESFSNQSSDDHLRMK
ncbi:cysteine-rich receptor-like protein kinase 42 [Andrographis paniculata]|uniref:cysteine-rich receptor-like protein kinase 42 n=1 Tax=Andrographis paniculata TaxID=175694 RepID=UPI0021E9073B|nr:cysteine-rich receptor-like protein kinase 42 [Andrographis paniculata]